MNSASPTSGGDDSSRVFASVILPTWYVSAAWFMPHSTAGAASRARSQSTYFSLMTLTRHTPAAGTGTSALGSTAQSPLTSPSPAIWAHPPSSSAAAARRASVDRLTTGRAAFP
ncbi:hypothetical protein ACFQX7_21800 [Luedemannella flava]